MSGARAQRTANLETVLMGESFRVSDQIDGLLNNPFSRLVTVTVVFGDRVRQRNVFGGSKVG